MVHDSCFSGEKEIGSCQTCGYWMDETDAGTAADCATCEEGYEIDVVYSDCTGMCVPEGTATTPISASDCEVPDAPEEIRDNCFGGILTATACETCGYYETAQEAANPPDCVTCPAGFEIDVNYGDCTGLCVAEGTAANPISTSSCEADYSCLGD